MQNNFHNSKKNHYNQESRKYQKEELIDWIESAKKTLRNKYPWKNSDSINRMFCGIIKTASSFSDSGKMDRFLDMHDLSIADSRMMKEIYESLWSKDILISNHQH